MLLTTEPPALHEAGEGRAPLRGTVPGTDVYPAVWNVACLSSSSQTSNVTVWEDALLPSYPNGVANAGKEQACFSQLGASLWSHVPAHKG